LPQARACADAAGGVQSANAIHRHERGPSRVYRVIGAWKL